MSNAVYCVFFLLFLPPLSLADNDDTLTSFSNPNYGLDAINSNSLTSPLLLSNDDSNADVDNGVRHYGNDDADRMVNRGDENMIQMISDE